MDSPQGIPSLALAFGVTLLAEPSALR